MSDTKAAPTGNPAAEPSTRTGRYAIIEQLLADGMDTMFGNPGTVEQGFLDSLEAYPDFRYVLTLQETIAVAMADGHARVTKRPTVVQLHSGVGLGNGIGMLYQAMRGHAPLVVLAGESGVKYDAMDAQMAADLVSMAKPVTKWATRVVDPSSLLRVLRRAVKIAATPPMGPVFVCLPADVLDAPNHEEVRPTDVPRTRVLPTADDVNHAATLLTGARAADHRHGRRDRLARRPGRARARRRAARGRDLGRRQLGSERPVRPPAVPRLARAHVRRGERQGRARGGRRADRGDLRVPRGLPAARRRLRRRRQGRPRRPERVRDRQEPPRRPRPGQRSDADPGGPRRSARWRCWAPTT
jgi:sulfopyruvate decarboxylase TPP-binding subunit